MGLWTTLAPPAVTRIDAASVASGATMYWIGGADVNSGSDYARNDLLNQTTNTWTAKANHIDSGGVSRGVSQHQALIASGVVHVVGGYYATGSTSYPGYWRTYTISSNTWATGAASSSPVVSSWLASETVAGVGYWIGGLNSSTNAARTATYSYTFSTKTFTSKAAIPAATMWADATLESVSVTGVIHLFGGSDNNVYYSTHRTYTPSSNTWATRAPLPSARATHGCAVVVPGIFNAPVVFGGYGSPANGAPSMADVNTWSPATNTWTNLPVDFPAPSGTGSSPGYAFGSVESLATDRATLVGGRTNPAYGITDTHLWNADNAPYAPALNAPIAGAAADATTPIAFAWTFADPDAGDSQSAWALRFVSGAITQWWNESTQALQSTEVFNPGTAGSVTLPANKLTNGVTYTWSVATRDVNGPATGPYSAGRTLNVSPTPIATVLAPYGVVTGPATQKAYWAYAQAAGNPQTNYQVKVFAAATVTGGGFSPDTSAAVWDSGQIASAATSVTLQNLANAASYYVFIRVAAVGPLWSAWASSAFTTSLNANLGTAVRLAQTTEYVYEQLTTQVARAVPDVDPDASVQNSPQPIIRLALGATDYTPTGTESGGVVPGEIATGGTLDSAVATVSHTTGTNSFVLQQNWSADQDVTIYNVGVVNNMPYEMAPGQSRYLPGSSNQRRLVFLMRPVNPIVAQSGETFETDVTVTF